MILSFLDIDLPEYHLEKGDIGTVVLVHQNHKGYEVEFITLEGETLVVISLFPSQIRTVQKREFLISGWYLEKIKAFLSFSSFKING